MIVRVTKRAQTQIDRAAQWWDEHRDLAPEAFDEDLAAVNRTTLGAASLASVAGYLSR